MRDNHRRERFVELAEKRVTRTIKDLRLIGNLSNRSNYKYDDADVKKIFAALDAEMKNLRHRFETQSTLETAIFKL